ncbi:hypothetical protein Goshw_015291, partial [Gossypium schwendimanii]|nr:hypothetical protein [Gossypium schwendimanii]
MMLDWDPPPTLFLFEKEEADKRSSTSKTNGQRGFVTPIACIIPSTSSGNNGLITKDKLLLLTKQIAASVGAVEALKDQGFWRWNHGIRALNQSAKNNVRSYSQANKLSSSSIVQSKTRGEKVKAGRGIFEKSDVIGLFGSLLTLM